MPLTRVQSGQSQLIFKDPSSEEETFYTLSRDADIEVNGEPASIDSLDAGDKLDLDLASDGKVTKIEAHRSIAGAVISYSGNRLTISPDYINKKTYKVSNETEVKDGKAVTTSDKVHVGDHVILVPKASGELAQLEICHENPLLEFWDNFRKNLFKPLLLFFYFGFLISVLRVPFEFPYPVYQGLTIYLLVAIGWHGGEELACLSRGDLMQAGLFMVVGFLTNILIGLIAYFTLRRIKKLRAIDAATVAAYYGSDSAGTFLTCMGVLQTAAIAYAAYMPVMLAIMEIPGCLIGLFLVSRLRRAGMDKAGNMPGEPRYEAPAGLELPTTEEKEVEIGSGRKAKLAGKKFGSGSVGRAKLAVKKSEAKNLQVEGSSSVSTMDTQRVKQLHLQQKRETNNFEILREIFLNPGLFLLMGGIAIGFISRLQGPTITAPDDKLFVSLFQGMLCLFLLEMGMNAANRIRDLKVAGKRFIAFGLLAPNLFAIIGIGTACLFSHAIGQPLQLGTYVLFAVLCAAASYIAVPAIQRLAIPEASPTLPLAASLGLTFTYNVTIGIPLYLVISEMVIRAFPFV